MHRESRLLKTKALASLRRSARAFNDLDDDGRVTTVLLHLQHALEMLLKASLREKGVRVLDKTSGRTIGFKKCASLGEEHLKLSKEQCGLLRTIDALRDDEQHYFGELSEGLLYVHIRAGFTLVDELLDKVFHERLADHLPIRVLPISTEPPADFDVLIDEQYSQIKKLLRPGIRRRAEARSKIRALLAMEGHAAEDVLVTEKDVNRVEKAIRGNQKVSTVFPRLGGVTTTVTGTGVNLTVRFTKREGAPVHFVPADDPRDTAAVREVDLQRKYRYSARDLAEKLNLTPPRTTALRRHLKLDDDEDSHHVFVFDSQRIPRYSDRALERLREAKESVDMDAVWAKHGPRRGSRA
jgi:hypothetical protein